MKFFWQFLQSVIVVTVVLLLLSTIHVPGQTIEPDEQIKREMIAYVRKTEDALVLSRPRIAGENVVQSKKPVASEIFFKESSNSTSLISLEQQAFFILNEKRLSKGLEPLKWNENLARVARMHSLNMAQFSFFSHAGTDGSMVNNRADALGISHWRSIGENIAFNRGFKKPSESACEQWMQSPAHRENILDGRWKETGIGIAQAADGTYYFTQVFLLK